jgi:hypothetical protein
MKPCGSDAKDQSGEQGAPADVRGQGAAQVNVCRLFYLLI